MRKVNHMSCQERVSTLLAETNASQIYNSSNYLWLPYRALFVTAPLFEQVFVRGFLLTGFSHTYFVH